MLKVDVIRAWKDEDYFLSLNETERSLLPDNPAGLVELTDEELLGVDGGQDQPITTFWNCSFITCNITFCPAYTVFTACPVAVELEQ